MHKYAIIWDFNFSNTWYEEVDVGGRVATVGHVIDECSRDTRFQSCLEENELTQMVTFPTYRNSRESFTVNTLDLLITSAPDQLIETSLVTHM